MTDAQTLIAEIARREVALSSDLPIAEIEGWDSLKGVRLVLRLEEAVGRELSEADIEGLQRISDIDRLLTSGT
jgi:acyl carrier protein